MDKEEFEKTFNEQDKNTDYTSKEIIEYRKNAKKTFLKNVDVRLNKATENTIEKEITEEKILARDRAYGIKVRQLFLSKDDNGNLKLEYRNFVTDKIIKSGVVKNEKLSSDTVLTKNDEILKKIETEPFNYGKYFIKEDNEPKQEPRKQGEVTVSYVSYFRYGVLIYLLKDGKKYNIIYQRSGVNSYTQKGKSGNEETIYVGSSKYIPYQRVIAQIKSDVLNDTGITLEEWVHLSRTRKDIYLEGGIRYIRKKGTKSEFSAYKESIDYEVNINFDEF